MERRKSDYQASITLIERLAEVDPQRAHEEIENKFGSLMGTAKFFMLQAESLIEMGYDHIHTGCFQS